ncbi:MAG: NAD(+) kinase [Watsoniomyces obsoletus]|nr:MAG: NAD(+) kinase [Watsoniomyces obsoletus]
MDSSSGPDEEMPAFFVGQHESNRNIPVTRPISDQAHQWGYDMITTPITTSSFHSRVLQLLSSASSSGDSTITIPPLTPSDTSLAPRDNINQLLAVSSPWIDLCSPDPLISRISRDVLNMEAAYASFCGFGNLIVSGPNLHHDMAHGDGLAQYARAVKEALDVASYISIAILLPMVDHPSTDVEEVTGGLARLGRQEPMGHEDGSKRENGNLRKGDLFGTWDVWHTIRTVCKYNQRLFVALTVPRHIPPQSVQDRWFAEPLRLLSLPSTTFLKNKSGYPVLSKAHQALIYRYMRLRYPPWLVLTDVGPIQDENLRNSSPSEATNLLSPSLSVDTVVSESSNDFPTPNEARTRQTTSDFRPRSKDPTPHLSYIRYLQRNQPGLSIIERFASGYQDYLQAPLQPLTENLESVTYEVFEKDPVKYEWYERAIAAALRDWHGKDIPGSGPNGSIVLAIVGAGRGPLVTRALQACMETGIRISLWAVEKNPNAYVLLQRYNQERWGEKVNVIWSDMRTWKGPFFGATDATTNEKQDPSSATYETYGKVDIIISELLGSFGDNELSPECLDGVQHVLNPTHGISIPGIYSAHLTPIACPRIHGIIKRSLETDSNAAETPYVVMLHGFSNLSTVPTSSGSKPVIFKAWEFQHPFRTTKPPSSDSDPNDNLFAENILNDIKDGNTRTSNNNNNQHNTRYARLSFPCPVRGACDGLAGYFETTLYGEVELSTRPDQIDSKSPDMTSWFPLFFPLKMGDQFGMNG